MPRRPVICGPISNNSVPTEPPSPECFGAAANVVADVTHLKYFARGALQRRGGFLLQVRKPAKSRLFAAPHVPCPMELFAEGRINHRTRRHTWASAATTRWARNGLLPT